MRGLNAKEYFSLLDFVNEESGLGLFNVGGFNRIKKLKKKHIELAIAKLKKMRYVDRRPNFKKIFLSISKVDAFIPRNKEIIKICERFQRKGLIDKVKSANGNTWHLTKLGRETLEYI